MKHNPVAKNAHKFNKSQAMKDRKKAMKKGERKHKGKMDEKLSASDDAGEWVKDFRKSDAPQFKGKSDKKKQQMAIAAYLDAKREKREAMEEKNKGLWHNIHQKRKRGERPAKPGEKGYPKTLDIEEDEDPCWKGYKQLGMKKKGGKQVPNCVPKEEVAIEEDVHARYMRAHGKKAKGQGQWMFTTSRTGDTQGKEFSQRGDFSAAHKAAQKHFGTKNVYVMEWACNRTEKTRRVSGGDKRKKYMKEKQVEEGSAQDRLNQRAAKLGIGNRNKAADDYMAKMKAKHGEKGVADRLASNQAKIDAIKKARQRREDVQEELSPVQKRKHMNLKKRAKAGNSQAKIRLKAFEKEFAKDIEMEKGSAKQVSKAVKGKGVGDVSTQQAFSGKGGGKGDDDNLIVQLRKAQDLNGKMDIKVTPAGKTAQLPKALIDKLLAGYDRLQKPEDKKKFKLLLTKELRKRAK